MHNRYLYHPRSEFWWILAPPFLVIAALVLLPSGFLHSMEGNPWFWLFVVVFIDVAHVYSTLFRTYFSSTARKIYKKEFWIIPVICFCLAFAFHLFLGELFFWRILAYAAVFHFVRQQYGFFRLYDRTNTNFWNIKIGNLAIYACTLYPILFWHLNTEVDLVWFTETDFLQINSVLLNQLAFYLYVFILVAYTFLEVINSIRTKAFNFPKNAILLGTACSWYLGIVYYKSDVAFTLLNVFSHGVPYIGLIIIHGRKKNLSTNEMDYEFDSHFFKGFGLFFFFLTICLFAYVEEGFWDWLIWHDHASVFPYNEPMTYTLPSVGQSFLVALLILPQLTHYVLDGFIWKIKKKNDGWVN